MAARCAIESKCAAARCGAGGVDSLFAGHPAGFVDAAHMLLDVLVHPESGFGRGDTGLSRRSGSERVLSAGCGQPAGPWPSLFPSVLTSVLPAPLMHTARCTTSQETC